MSNLLKAKVRQKRRAYSRLISMICIVAFFLTACTGCTSYVPEEEMDSVKMALEEEIKALKSANGTLQADVSLLKARNEAEQQEIDALKSGKEVLQQEIDALKSDKDALQQEIDALQSADATLQQTITAMETRIQELEQQIEALQNDNLTMKEELETLKAEKEALQEEIAELREQIRVLQESTPSDEPNDKIRIYIDQGHNPATYHNAGAVGNGLYEGDVTFAIGCALAQLLEADGRFEVCLSRPTESTVLGNDYSSSLAARVQGAEDFEADYFISLHINAYPADTANGIEVYVKEEGSEAYAFGSSLLQGLVDATELRNRNMKTNPDLYVLKNTTMPAALLEMGFISNPDDAALLESNPTLFAQGIYNGILSYFGLTAPNTDTN